MKQLFTFFILAFLISWIIWLPLYGHIFGLTNLPTLPFHHAFGGLGPLIASILTTSIYLKREGVNKLIKKCFQLKPLIYLLVALLSPFILVPLASLILPLFFYRPRYTTMDIAGGLGWIFSLLTGSILLTWLYNSSIASILICAVFHSTIDIAFTADIANKNIINYMGFLITVWGILTIIIFKPKNLAENYREQVIIN